MQKDKYTSKINTIGKWLFKVALLFSVFTFSGFNVQIQSTLNQTYKTELVENRTSTSVYCINDYYRIQIENLPSSRNLFNHLAFLNLNKLIQAHFKSFNKLAFHFPKTSIRVPYNLPSSSSEDEFHLTFLS